MKIHPSKDPKRFWIESFGITFMVEKNYVDGTKWSGYLPTDPKNPIRGETRTDVIRQCLEEQVAWRPR